VKLYDFRGKKNVVLTFCPAAFTGGRTKEMQVYQFGLDKFEGAQTQVFGVSTDSSPSRHSLSLPAPEVPQVAGAVSSQLFSVSRYSRRSRSSSARNEAVRDSMPAPPYRFVSSLGSFVKSNNSHTSPSA
jgi:hypothetical protein